MITTVTVGSRPFALVYNSTNNKVYCANYWSDEVTIIDGDTDSVITTITVGYEPCAFTYNPHQNRVYVANERSSSISVIRDVTGIEESNTLDASSLMPEIYPNPARNYFTVRIPLTTDCIKMFDVLGKLVKEININSPDNDNKGDVRISLEGIRNGVYFVKVDNNPQATKIIVTR